jgi:hypothetical protein
VAILAVSCAHEAADQSVKDGADLRKSDSGDARREGPGGERKKTWSGLSFAAQTYVQRSPSLSLATSGFDSERVWGGDDDWEPAVAADPGAPYVYQMTTRFTGSPAEIIFRRSVDGGATWEGDQVFMPNSGDPMVEVADDGTVYTLGIVGNQWNLLLRRSFDHGFTWTDPLDVIGGRGPDTWGDRPVLVISADGQDVYVAYNRGDIFVVASHDGGETFDTEVQVTDNGRQWFTSAGAVAPNGDLYFAAADYTSNYTGTTYINVLRSTDGGVSWTVTLLDASAESSDCSMVDGCYFNFLGPEILIGRCRLERSYGDLERDRRRQQCIPRDGRVAYGSRRLSRRLAGRPRGQHDGLEYLDGQYAGWRRHLERIGAALGSGLRCALQGPVGILFRVRRLLRDRDRRTAG